MLSAEQIDPARAGMQRSLIELPGTFEDARYREPILAHYPQHTRRRLEDGYVAAYSRAPKITRPGEFSPIGEANQWLSRTHRKISTARPKIAFDESQLRQAAKFHAERCSTLSRELAIAYAQNLGVKLPQKSWRMPGWPSRLSCVGWWMRQLRKLYARNCEEQFRCAGFVHRNADPYVSNDRFVAAASSAIAADGSSSPLLWSMSTPAR